MRSNDSLLWWRDEYGPSDRRRIRSLGSEDKIEFLGQLLFRGATQQEAARLLGVSKWVVAGWLRDRYEDVRRSIKASMARAALAKIPDAMRKLEQLLESESEEVRRKAISDLARIAGIAIDPAAGPALALGIGTGGGNLELKLDFKSMSNDELRRYRESMAALAGGGKSAAPGGGEGTESPLSR